jgi:hypothetical protein
MAAHLTIWAPMSARNESRDASRSGRDASTLALVSWVLPGAGHLMQGRAAFGVVAFLVVEGLYWLGLRLSGGMTFEFLDPELRTALAPILSPEAGNLGGFLYQMRTYGYGPGYPRPWPELIRIGSMLTALSGTAGVFVMAHAHLVARSERPDLDPAGNRPVLAMMLAWLVPGLGHVFQGRRVRGAMVFLALVGLFLLGTYLAEGSNLSRERHFYYWSGQFLIGLPGILSELAFGDMRVTSHIPYVDTGLVFGCVAGLLNVLAMIDVYAYGEAELLGLPLKTHEAAGSEAAA